MRAGRIVAKNPVLGARNQISRMLWADFGGRPMPVYRTHARKMGRTRTPGIGPGQIPERLFCVLFRLCAEGAGRAVCVCTRRQNPKHCAVRIHKIIKMK